MREVKKTLTTGEKIIADQVADEILVSDEEKEKRRYFILLLIFLICLIFLVSSLSFAIFDSYYNGGKTNVIDVGIDVVVDDKDKDKDNDKDYDHDRDNDNDYDKDDDDDEDKDHNVKPDDDKKPLKPGSVLFSFNEGSNYIDMVDVFPTSDSVGKELSGDNEYFDFNVSANLGKNNKGNMIYEISIVPVAGNTINEDDVRVYLTEDGKDVSVTSDMVNNLGDLPDSSYDKTGKVIYRKVVKNNYSGNYVFRMWLSADADVADVSQKFACKIVVNAYYK